MAVSRLFVYIKLTPVVQVCFMCAFDACLMCSIFVCVMCGC